MVDRDFGNWFAGFVDGEGCFYIAKLGPHRPGVYRPRFSLTLRRDDRPLIEKIAQQTKIGTIHEYEPTGPGRRVVRWMVQSQSDCTELCAIFDRHPLRSKKSRDYPPWRETVKLAAQLQRGRNKDTINAPLYAAMKVQKTEIERVRAYD